MSFEQESVRNTQSASLIVEEDATYHRYSNGAKRREEQLCCPVDYPRELLAAIPDEVLERDYGCGDPTSHVRESETVLDLGSGGGKSCFIAAQIVGPSGCIIGVDCNRDMLSLARSANRHFASRVGYENVHFRCGLIQDLRLDLEKLAESLMGNPVADQWDYLKLRHIEETLRREPMIPDESVDCILSNCVLNLVRPQDRTQLFSEVFRVLKRGGRVAISDIVSDEDVPEAMQQDPELWSGCISGAFREDRFLRAFEAAGFHGILVAKRQAEPWRVVQGIEFRSVTVVAYKGKQGPCMEHRQAVVYTGPFKRVEDDDGHSFPRGERIAVCDKTFQLLQQEPYGGLFEPISPRNPVAAEDALPFDCRRSKRRHPHETKGENYQVTTEAASDCCKPGDGCC